MKEKALIAMSGGVDSSVAAYLIKSQGYETCGITLKLYSNPDDIKCRRTCCSLDDVEDARSVANKLDIPYYVLNFKDNFEETVIKNFVTSYQNGLTPNPCIECNRYIKFNQLLSRANQLDFDYVVTGHYIQRDYDKQSGRYLLKKAVDHTKDQSYVLYTLTQDQLKQSLFPLGTMTKHEVREIADAHGFINSQKPDSQDICFVPDGDYAAFIEKYTGIPSKIGNFIDKNGNILGTHKGIIHYTIGQRKGLGLSLAKPAYVIEKNLDNNTVTLGSNDDLFTTTLTANNINLIAVDKITEPLKLKAKTRYSQIEEPAIVNQIDEDTIHVEFTSPQRAITPGQAVVLYDDDIVVGGGTIL